MNDSIRITYVEADSVVNTLNGSEGAAANNHNNRTLIVDVRDNHEFVAGHITGAFHLPSSQWVEPTIVEDFLTENLPRYDTFVFHCQKSQSRGPNCARMCAQALENYTRTRDLPRETLPKIAVLTGGFQEFKDRYGDRTDLVEQPQQEELKEDGKSDHTLAEV